MGKTTENDIRMALEKLPIGSGAYDHAYMQAMERIQEQDADGQKLAKAVLFWITCARRPLITAELQHALAIKVGDSDFNEKSRPDVEDMVSVCAGLVTVDEESKIIRLVHYTTQEYFERTQESWFPNAEDDITIACVTYLSFSTFESGFCATDEEFEERLQSNQLYDYAACNWGYHAYKAATLTQKVIDFLNSDIHVQASSQAMMVAKRYSSHSNYSQEAPRHMKGSHLAACFGLKNAINALLTRCHDLDSKDDYGRTPLSWAAGQGHEAVVKLLLGVEGVDPDSKDTDGQTPLAWAAGQGHEAVVKLLLGVEGVDPDSKDTDGQTPLAWAAGQGHEAVVKLLLGVEGVDPDSKDTDYGQTPLAWAAEQGHEAVVKLLLGVEGVDPDSKDTDGQTPLARAAEQGHEAVVKLLLGVEGVDPDSKDDLYGQTPLSRAAEQGHEAVVKLLLGVEGVDPDSKDDLYGQTPLSRAAGQGHEAVVKLLLGVEGVDPDSKSDLYGQTPLSRAAGQGHEAVVKLLLGVEGVDPDSKDTDYGRYEAVVKLLLGVEGVDPDSKDKRGQTPLSRAAEHDHEAVVKLLQSRDSLSQ